MAKSTGCSFREHGVVPSTHMAAHTSLSPRTLCWLLWALHTASVHAHRCAHVLMNTNLTQNKLELKKIFKMGSNLVALVILELAM